jgi:hypothetical protein
MTGRVRLRSGIGGLQGYCCVFRPWRYPDLKSLMLLRKKPMKGYFEQRTYPFV